MTDRTSINLYLPGAFRDRVTAIADRHRWSLNQTIRILAEIGIRESENNPALLLAGPDDDQNND